MATGVYCASCGYDLAGLPAGKCPECERGFDPGDAATFDARPRRTWWRRWTKRGVIVAAAVAVIVALAPRGYVGGTLVIDDGAGTVLEFERIQLVPPRWLTAATGWTYPGWTSRSTSTGQARTWKFTLKTRGSLYGLRGAEGMGSSMATGVGQDPVKHTLNGVVVSPENADAVFRSILPDMAAGRSYGVTLGTSP